MLKCHPKDLVSRDDVLIVTKLSNKEKKRAVDKQMKQFRRNYWNYYGGVSGSLSDKELQVFGHNRVGQVTPGGVAFQMWLNAWQAQFNCIHFRTDLGFDMIYENMAKLYFIFGNDNLSSLARRYMMRQQRASEVFFGISDTRPGLYDFIICAERMISDLHGAEQLTAENINICENSV